MFGFEMQRLRLNLVLACSFLFKLCFYWTLCTVGMTSGWDMMSSSGQLLTFSSSSKCCFLSFYCFVTAVVCSNIFLHVSGMLPCLLFHSYATWQRSHLLVSSFICLLHLDKIVDSTHSSS